MGAVKVNLSNHFCSIVADHCKCHHAFTPPWWLCVYEFSKVSSLIYLSYSQSTGLNSAAHPPTVSCFYFVCEHQLHGIVTGLKAIRTIHSLNNKLDRLLVSFKDMKASGSVVSLYPCFLTFRVVCTPRMVCFYPWCGHQLHSHIWEGSSTGMYHIICACCSYLVDTWIDGYWLFISCWALCWPSIPMCRLERSIQGWT